jgi:hypothetical protein
MNFHLCPSPDALRRKRGYDSSDAAGSRLLRYEGMLGAGSVCNLGGKYGTVLFAEARKITA